MRVALAASLALLVLALVLVLSGSPLTVAATNSIPAYPAVAYAHGGSSGCQLGGAMPQGTTAIRLSISQNTGPSVALKAFSGTLPITQGKRGAGWGIDETVTVPVKRVPRTIPETRICIAFGPAVETIEINGSVVDVATARGEQRRARRFRVEYLRPGHSSWWSLASSVARRMGLGHAPSGTWIALVVIALMIALAGLTSWLLLEEQR